MLTRGGQNIFRFATVMDNSGDHFDDGDTYPEILEPIAYENTQLSDFEDDLNTSNVLNFLFEISPNGNNLFVNTCRYLNAFLLLHCKAFFCFPTLYAYIQKTALK